MTVKIELKLGDRAEKSAAQMREMTHKVFLVSLGAVALAGDELQKAMDRALALNDRAVERGERLESESRDFVTSRREEARENLDEAVKVAVKDTEKRFDRYSKTVLTTMHLPSTSDVNSLNRKLNLLNRKLKELEKVQANGHH